MFKLISRAVQRHPWPLLFLVILVTLGFSMLLPSIEMRTDIKDFMPDNELVKADLRYLEYFGGAKQITLVYAKGKESILNPGAMRELFFAKEELSGLPEINMSISFSDFINQLCLMEFGKGIANCSDDEIETAVKDLLTEWKNETRLLTRNDGNENILDDLDVKNCKISYDNSTLKIEIEVYGLSNVTVAMRKLFTNCLEWYVNFRNRIVPSEELNMDYKISAHIEPKHKLWVIGKGPLKNLANLIAHAKELRDYRKDVYLWIKPNDQSISYPIRLENATFELDFENNKVIILVSRDELSRFGIGLKFASLYLPAKLGDFTVGSRCYKGIFNLPWGRVAVNTSFLIKGMEKIHEFPLLSRLEDKVLKKVVGLKWNELKELIEKSKSYFPKDVSLKDMEKFWVDLDKVESSEVLFLKPPLFDEVRLNALSFLSDDRGSALVVLWVEKSDEYMENIEINKKILKEIEKLNQKNSHLSLRVTGDGIVTLQVHDLTNQARKVIEPLIFVIILLILLLFFRRFSYIILPMLSLAVSIIWTFGTMVLLGMPFNALAVAVIPLLLGLGVDYSIHLSNTYLVEREKGKDPKEAIGTAIEEVGRALFLSMLTTAIAFLSFLSASIPPVRNFGLLLSFGILYTFINALALQAPLRYLIDRKKGDKVKERRFPSLEKGMEFFARFILKNKKLVVVFVTILSACMLFEAAQSEVSFDFREFIPENNPAIKLFDRITEDFPHAGHDQEHILIEGKVDTVDALKGIRRTHLNLRDDRFVARRDDGSVKVLSIYTLIKQSAMLNKSLVKKFNLDENFIPRTDEDVRRLFDYLYDSKLYGAQARALLYREGNLYKATVIQVEIDPSISKGKLSHNLHILSREINDDLSSYGNARAIATGPLLITLSIIDSLTKNQIRSTLFSFILAFLILLIVYRRFLLALTAMIPVTISMVWILGTMHLVGFSLNVLTISITSLTIGMGIDYAIHTIERYRLIISNSKKKERAVERTISHTGSALLISALTTASGFSVLIFAPMPPQVQFGLITALTISYAFIITVALLPVVLVKLRYPSK